MYVLEAKPAAILSAAWHSFLGADLSGLFSEIPMALSVLFIWPLSDRASASNCPMSQHTEAVETSWCPSRLRNRKTCKLQICTVVNQCLDMPHVMPLVASPLPFTLVILDDMALLPKGPHSKLASLHLIFCDVVKTGNSTASIAE